MMLKRSLCLCLLLALCSLVGCAQFPDNSQIESAIRFSLSEEYSPPKLDFDSMVVPMRSAGKASAVLWTADGEIKRDYALIYDEQNRAFAVAGFTTSQRRADKTYYFVPNDPNLVLTKLAPCFDFSADFSQKYLLLYVGEGDELAALRTAFEGEKLGSLTAEQRSRFEVCDLGGDALILLVPRYEGLCVGINEIEHQGDLMKNGAQAARFESGLPIYIYCSFSDKLPEYEIHIYFDERDEFFNTREYLLTSLKESE